MRVNHDSKQISTAAFLLCMLAAFAVSPVDCFVRAQIGGRARTARVVRLDDHDHDHALDVVSIVSDSLTTRGTDGPFNVPVLIPVNVSPEWISSGLVLSEEIFASTRTLDIPPGRGPPILL